LTSRTRGPRNLPATLLLAFLLLSAVAANAHFVSAYTPLAGDSFNYSETITVNNGQGAYSGYTDLTQVSGSERVAAVTGSVVSMSYSYSFQYSSNQGTSSSSQTSGAYTWSSSGYTYINGTDNQVGYTAPVYVWFAMNPSTPVGGSFNILNTRFTVLSKNYSFELPTQDRYVQTIQAEGTGSYTRNDSYGVFTATYTWYEYFDPATGYVVGYNYVEQDSGEYQGQTGGFTYTDNLYVTSSSYPLTAASAPAGGSTSLTSTAAGTLYTYLDYAVGGIVILAVIIIVAIYAATRRRRMKPLPEHSPTPPAPPPSSSESSPWQSGVQMGSRPPEQVVIKEVAMKNCKYCNALIPTTAQTCPYCGAPNR
jgi:hypothetical protein